MIDSGYGLNRFAHFIKIRTTIQKKRVNHKLVNLVQPAWSWF